MIMFCFVQGLVLRQDTIQAAVNMDTVQDTHPLVSVIESATIVEIVAMILKTSALKVHLIRNKPA